MKKYLTEEEMYPMLAQFANQIHEQIEELQDKMNKRFDTINQDLVDFRNEVRQNFDYHEKWLNRIESNMVQKNSFNTLLKILEQKEVISKYDSAHILHPTTI